MVGTVIYEYLHQILATYERLRHAHKHILWLLSDLKILRQTVGVVVLCIFFYHQ